MILRHVRPEELKEHWPKISEGLAKLKDQGPDWLPEDAYHLLRLGIQQGGAQLSLIADDGFLIWQRYPGDDGRGILFILAWVAYEPFGMLKHYKGLDRELNELAVRMNCRRIRHISKHREYEQLRWTLLGHVYERDVVWVAAADNNQ